MEIIDELKLAADMADDLGEPGDGALYIRAVGEIRKLRETLAGIAEADWRKWEELASPDEFVRWAKSQANHALTPNVK